MAYRVKVSPIALEEAQSAFNWMDQRSEAKAAAWYTGLLDAIFSLEEMPRRCSLAPENDNVDEEVRHLLYTRGRVVYRIIYSIRESENEDNSIVQVHHIRHSAQEPVSASQLKQSMQE